MRQRDLSAHVVMYYVIALATVTQRHDRGQRPERYRPGRRREQLALADLIAGI